MTPVKSDPRRAFPRFKAFIATQARCGGEDVRAHVLDVARGGARLHTDRQLRTNDRATLRFGERRLAGTIVWSRDTKSGFRFDVPMTASEVQRIFETC